ncbi:NAD(+) diphosphatase [Microbacterium sp. G2-8]|uniref:NAD(+) diphosphatase n=1 Tax=Microbacterium sp. G2-8 TaxID=2842454 RepID=UPI001C8A3C71|nr:NAD(+) diphosphatase [Microbacterium sp. G2-8]
MTGSAQDDVFDISADERTTPGVVEALRADADTRVLLVHGDRVPVSERHRIAFSAARDAPSEATWAFLGRDDRGAGLLAAVVGGDIPPSTPEDASAWASFREVGSRLPAAHASLATAAIALGRWLVDASFCPACGELTSLETAGWSRRCGSCAREHFPRTDPAVIVAVTSADGERLLLGANAAWRGRMYSCFAGFIEAGESVESTIHRELAEEAGVRVRDIRYIDSQAWPYPRSLMLGFHATAVDDAEARPDGDEIIDVRWMSRDEVARGLRGEGDVALPSSVSVAHRIIRSWVDGQGSTER